MSDLDVRLIATLRSSEVHLPAADLASQLRVPVTTIETHLAELVAAGFEFEERPELGFRLRRSPDRLMADDLLARLGACELVREIIVFNETGSTNDYAMQRGRQGAAAGLAVFAERQTTGRGRFGRPWVSTSHRGLLFSLLLRPDLPVNRWPRLPTWAAVALAATIESESGLAVKIKWPNDIYLDGRKVAGILAESGTDSRGQPFAVVGIGLNVNHEAGDFPSELGEKAGSLRMATGRLLDRSALAAALLRELDAGISSVASEFSKIIAEATRRSLLLGHWVQLRSAHSLVEGRAESLDEDGHLLLRGADGLLRRLTAGEVTVIAEGR